MEKKTGLVLILSVLLTLSLGSLVSAAQLSVPSDQYSTIQAAVDAAGDGDEIIVSDGPFDEDVTVDGKSGINITAKEGTVLNGSFTFISIYDVQLSGFTIKNEEGSGITVKGLLSGLKILNNTVTDCKKNGIFFPPGSLGKELVIKGNDVSGNGKDGISLLGGLRDVKIKGNKINDNGAENPRGVGIRLSDETTDVVIEENKLSGNAFANIHPQ